MSPDTASLTEHGAADILQLDEQVELGAPDVRARVREALERGDVLLLLGRGFALTERERQIVTNPQVMSRGREAQNQRNGRPTLTFNLARDRLNYTSIRAPERREIEAMLRRYAVWARELLTELAPDYAAACEENRVIYRPVRRTKPIGLHVDASYRHPTQGRSKLRIFCNVDPEGRPREWQIGERFESYASRYVPLVQGERPWSKIATERIASLVGYIEGERTAFDHLIEDIRRLAKQDRDYQTSAPCRGVSFPPGATWVALTDIVLHRGVSGQHSLDEVFFLPMSAMRDPSSSALRTLERLSGRSLA